MFRMDPHSMLFAVGFSRVHMCGSLIVSCDDDGLLQLFLLNWRQLTHKSHTYDLVYVGCVFWSVCYYLYDMWGTEKFKRNNNNKWPLLVNWIEDCDGLID